MEWSKVFKARSEVFKKNYYDRKYSKEEKIMNVGWKFQIINETLKQEDNLLNISLLCEIARVSRSGYYRWIKSTKVRQKREEKDRQDFELILRAYHQHGYNKRAKGIYMCMLHWEKSVIINLKKIRRLMNKYGLVCPIRKANPYKRMAKAIKTNDTAENILNREFTKYGARKVLLTDITYIPYENTFCYLSTILDAYTRQILSYALSDSL